MIGHLRGKLASKTTSGVILDVQGVGYDISIPVSTFSKLPDVGGDVELKIYTHVREDQFHLYGFLSVSQKELFQILLSVSGIGPRAALTVISELSPEELTQVVLMGNVKRLTAIPGVGKKIAARLILELKEKMKKLSVTLKMSDMTTQSTDSFVDLGSALSNLGYKQSQIEQTILQLREEEVYALPFEDLLKRSLRMLRS